MLALTCRHPAGSPWSGLVPDRAARQQQADKVASLLGSACDYQEIGSSLMVACQNQRVSRSVPPASTSARFVRIVRQLIWRDRAARGIDSDIITSLRRTKDERGPG